MAGISGVMHYGYHQGRECSTWGAELEGTVEEPFVQITLNISLSFKHLHNAVARGRQTDLRELRDIRMMKAIAIYPPLPRDCRVMIS